MVKNKEDLAVQPDLPSISSSSPMGKAARQLMAVRDEIDETIESLDKRHNMAKEKLLDLMTQEGKDAIVVDGMTFRKVHKDASDEIRVLSKKRKKKKEEVEDED